VAALPETRTCRCGSALKHAIITDRAAFPPETKEELRLLIGKYTGD
jgi:5'-methylthioadenosine phosphorylase